MLEHDAVAGDPEEYLHAAPVKSVLRCGIRWVKGFPVAPIPYIPGLGSLFLPTTENFKSVKGESMAGQGEPGCRLWPD